MTRANLSSVINQIFSDKKKLREDKTFLGYISESACGYETKISSGPSSWRSSIGMSTISEIWPRTEKMIKPAKIEVKEFTRPIRRVSRISVEEFLNIIFVA